MTRRRLTIALGAWLVCGAGMLRGQEPVDGSMIARIREEGLQRSRVEQTFSHLTDVIGPRLTGSPAFKGAADWSDLRQQTRTLLQHEERLREVAEIVGTEGLQDADRLVMTVAEQIRRDFLAQSAYTDDAFSRPADTHRRIGRILDAYRGARQRLDRGERLDEILRPRS